MLNGISLYFSILLHLKIAVFTRNEGKHYFLSLLDVSLLESRLCFFEIFDDGKFPSPPENF